MGLIILQGPCLKERTTLRLGGNAIAEVVLDSLQDCDALPHTLATLGGPPLVLGYGSNILATDGPLPWVVVNPAFRDEPQIIGEDAQGVLVRVGAGFRLPRLLGWLCARGLTGMEGLTGIPGTVGGAVAMNAGSYGCETGELLVQATIFDPINGIRTWDRSSLNCAYRHFSILQTDTTLQQPEWKIVVDAIFRLTVADSCVVSNKMSACYAKKKATQPVTSHSAGCVFKNPSQNISAGMLLDNAGFKGKRIGNMAFSEMHANFLINTGGGTSKEAIHLLTNAQDKVKKDSGYNLELEVKIIR